MATKCPHCLNRDTLFRTYNFSPTEESVTFKCKNCEKEFKIYYWRKEWHHAQSLGKSVKNCT